VNAVHLHLLINHLPILGCAFGLLVLGYGFLVRTPSQQVRNAAYLILIVSALGAFGAQLSGEGAEEAVEHLAGVSEDRIKAHEDAAPFAVGLSALAGALSLGGLILSIFKPAWNGRLAWAACLAALLAFAAVARVGWLGGKIRHTELDRGGPAPAGATGDAYREK
jgi:hypothetical protein